LRADSALRTDSALRADGLPRTSSALRTAELTKFYVVRTPEENGGAVDGLQDIAGRVLGDPDRFQEILVLNTGRVLPGGDVFVSAEQLVPGFALRLPTDAEGPGVQFGELPEEAPGAAQQSAPPQPPSATRSGGPFGAGGKVPVGLVAGGAAGVAALTVAVLARRPLTRWLRALGRGVARVARVLRPRLPRPLAVALRRRRRARLARRLAADTRTPVLVRSALDELVGAGGPGAPTRVFTVRADGEQLLASVSGGTRAPAPWTAHAPHDWRRAGLPSTPGYEPRREGNGGSATRAGDLEVRGAMAEYRPSTASDDDPDAGEAPQLTLPHLARVGVDARDAQVMVGLGQLNGALSVRGDLRVARDTLTALAHGLLELPWQNTVVVAVDPDPDTLPGLHGLVRVRSLAEVEDQAPARVFEAAEALGLGLVRAPSGPDRITGFLLMMRPPRDSAEAHALAGLAAPHGGWSVLSVGDVPGAHWRWHAEPEGTVDLGVLGLRVTVPAALALSADRV
ncbi:hypothetical protein ABZX40_05250, partial [Streptomyces sp. NPDC004610]|uniref:hypothetical protein n=1 Tax=unclassified Streptomyces TaxID=2593676 RepID=UPI0033B8F95F